MKSNEQTTSGPTYAQITRKQVNKTKTKINISDIIIKPKNKEDLQKVFKETKMSINKNTNIPIHKIITTNDKIIIKCKNK